MKIAVRVARLLIVVAVICITVHNIYLPELSRWLEQASFGMPQSVARFDIQSDIESSTKIKSQESEGTFSACILWKDDNHFLREWLAYHYQVLPLRRLIIAVDPSARTSPTEILDRYRNRKLMNITVWSDHDYWPAVTRGVKFEHRKPYDELSARGKVDRHRYRQITFYQKCTTQLKQENRTWTLMIDNDEFLYPNTHVRPELVIPSDSKNNKTTTMWERLEHAHHANISPMYSSPCIGLPRLLFGGRDSNSSIVQAPAPLGFNGSDFMTLSWRFNVGWNANSGQGKAIVDLSRVNASHLVEGEINVHRVIRSLCSKSTMSIKHRNSIFTVHHYTGSWEQWSFRVDARKDLKMTKTKEKFDETIDRSRSQDDSSQEWLQDFVTSIGEELAKVLLEGSNDTSSLQAVEKDIIMVGS